MADKSSAVDVPGGKAKVVCSPLQLAFSKMQIEMEIL
jgi:hypothetical protein